MIIKLFKFLFLLAIVMLLCVNCTNGPLGPQFQGSNEINGDENGSSPSESDNGNGDSNNGSNSGPDYATIDDLITALSIPGADSEAFQSPSSTDRTSFNKLVADLLGGKTVEASAHSALGYSLKTIGDDTLLALVEDSNTGGGTFLFNRSVASNLVIEIPHPIADGNTLDEGALLFDSLDAKALFIAGTHRCANAATSSCSGTTDACGTEEAYRISDVAHATENYFHEAHKAAHDTLPLVHFIQLHDFDAAQGEPVAIVSNGTETIVGPFAFVNRVADAIHNRLSGEDFAVSCNQSGDDGFGLCGTTNVQGRYTNGSSDECSTDPTGFNGQFIHIEQDSTLISDSNGWQLVSDAIDEVF